MELSHCSLNHSAIGCLLTANIKRLGFADVGKTLISASSTSNIICIFLNKANHLNPGFLVRKMFHFDLTGFSFNEDIQTWSVPISNNTIVFLGVIEIETFEDLKTAIRFLFSGIYDSQDFLIQQGSIFAKSEITTLLEKALLPIKNRHGENQDVIISMSSLCQHKKDVRILYPYGGTDFGSLMLFVV